MTAAKTYAIALTLLAACATTKEATPPQAAVSSDAPLAASDEAKCQEAAALRDQGYKALSELRLAAAKRAYNKSLDLDPGNKGALMQLDVIDALAEDRQIGTSAANNNVYGGVNRSPCEKYASSQMPSLRPAPGGKVTKPTVALQGQIVTFAKGTVKPAELLTQDEVENGFKIALRQFQGCYVQAVAKNPTLRGDLTLQISVDPAGKVNEVKFNGNTLYEDTVEQCVAGIAGKIAFPKRRSKHDMNVIYPMSFGPADDVALAQEEQGPAKTRAGR